MTYMTLTMDSDPVAAAQSGWGASPDRERRSGLSTRRGMRGALRAPQTNSPAIAPDFGQVGPAQLEAEIERRVRERLAQLHSAGGVLDSLSQCFENDLRTPLRAIEGLSALLAEHASRLEPQSAGGVECIRAANQRLNGLLADLLEFSRIGSCAMHKSTVDLSALAHDIAARLSQEDPGHPVEWVIAPGLKACGDAALLRRLLEHLLGNARKFSRRQGSARIEVGGVGAAAGCPEFFVRDNGVGFEPQGADALFSIFRRLPGAEAFEGNGIGLATVRRIAERHGGWVHADAAPGAGSSFTFSIPDWKAAYAGTAVPRSPTPDSARRLRMLRELPRLSVGALAVFTIGLLMIAVSAVVH